MGQVASDASVSTSGRKTVGTEPDTLVAEEPLEIFLERNRWPSPCAPGDDFATAGFGERGVLELADELANYRSQDGSTPAVDVTLAAPGVR